LIYAISSHETFLCFASYHSDNVEIIRGEDLSPLENSALRASSCFSFMNLPIPPMGRHHPWNRQILKKADASLKAFEIATL
jgi:hypothetical protein